MHPIKDLFPYHRNQMPYAQHYYPSFESIPPQMKVDALRSPVTDGTWPYENHLGHSIPVGCHGCCTHSYFPSYSGFRPAYPHYLPPTPFHYHGGYPSFPETYPVQFVPLSPYSMDQPRYEYDKNKDRDHHCCGCPNHPANKIEDRLVKTEEQEQEFGKKSSKSLVPVELKNQPYPVVYLPSDYVKREKRNLAEPELKERDEYPYTNQKPSERLPSDWSKWFPFDVDGFGSLNHGGDRKGTQKKPNEDKNQVSFPKYLMPYKPQEEAKRDHKEARTFINVNTGRVSSERLPFQLKATSAHLPNSDEKSGREVLIPVKQLEEHEETMMKEEAEAKSRGITVKDKDDSEEKQPSENGTKRRSSSPLKKSKFPPVCLRVDPLPNGKKGNGSSRSSPPDHKGKLHQLCAESNKAASPQEKEHAHRGMQSSSCIINETKQVEPNEKKRRVVVVADGYGDDCKIRSQAQVPVSFPIVSHENVSANWSTSNGGSADDVHSVKEDKEVGEVEEEKTGGSIGSEEEEISEEVKKPKWENLSEAEAAVAIQSAYRRFEVRRWEPLKKMKLIAEVREQVGSVKGRVEALENSPDISSANKHKQMVVIGETIMSLLLKLDTIQGLHPSIRDFRKSVVKELVSLQEKLDSLATKESVVSTAKLVEDLPVSTGEYVCSQGEQKEAKFGQEKGIGESNNHSNFGSQVMETSDPKLDEKEVCDEPEDKTIASSFESSMESREEEAEAVNKQKDGFNHEVIDDGQAMMLKTGVEDQELKLSVEPLPMDAEENVDLADELTLPSCPGDQVEFPRVSGEVHAVEESQRNERIEAGESEVLQRGGVESLLAINLTSMDFEETYQVQQPLDALKEEQVFADPVDETKGERVSDFKEEPGIKQAELPVQTQGEEFGRIIEPEAGAKQHEGGELLPVSPTTRKVSVRSDMASESDRKLLEENEKLRDMMVKLIEAGREQLTTLSNLSNRIKDLEKKLARKKKVRMRRASSGSSCVNPSNDSLKGRAHGIAV
ncbi:BAG family molecular chaperone regulator 6-like [Actinidia eriantha]|uniref:BAG family molecular chaperone regulator 6-like n=1 Tax=Actinidia eriantha TaxID=165200 RepID=UPI002589FF39|nr:BAG family molecular chaperone regulator 6-like [Actinidia eriantha]